MRRIFTGAALAVSVCVLPMESAAAVAGQVVGQPDDPDDELVLEDDGDDAAPPAAQASDIDPDLEPDTSFLDDDDSDPDVGAAAPSGSSAGAPGSAPADEDIEIDQDAIDEKMITVVSWQPMLNVFRKDDKKVHRWELMPQFGISVNDPYVRHYSVGGEVNFWLTNRMALGLSATFFFGDKTAAYDDVRYQEGILLTANRYVWDASLGILYEPFYGKIAVFNRLLLHWESYIQLGGGVIQSRVIPRFEVLHRPFSSILPQGNFAIGVRFYVPGASFFSVNMGVRTSIFQDLLEPRSRGPNTNPSGDLAQLGTIDDPKNDNPDVAKENAREEISYNSTFFLGFSFYLPPTFQYSTRP